MESWNVWTFSPGFLYLASCFQEHWNYPIVELHFFLWLQKKKLLQEYNTFVYSFISWWTVSCSYFLTTMNNPGINKHLIFFNIYQGADLLGNVAILLKISEKLSCCFSERETPFPYSHMKVLFFPLMNLFFFPVDIMLDEK